MGPPDPPKVACNLTFSSQDHPPLTPKQLWAWPGSAHHEVFLSSRVPMARNARGKGVTPMHAHHCVSVSEKSLKRSACALNHKICRCLKQNHLEERLLDQAQARASYTTLFWGHSRSIPQGMILDVQPLVKSLFCPLRPSPNGFFDSEASIP